MNVNKQINGSLVCLPVTKSTIIQSQTIHKVFTQKIPRSGRMKNTRTIRTREKDHVRQAALPVFSRHSPSDVVVCHFPPDNDPKVHINKRNSCFVGGLWKLFLGLNLPEIWTRLLSYVQEHNIFYTRKRKQSLEREASAAFLGQIQSNYTSAQMFSYSKHILGTYSL